MDLSGHIKDTTGSILQLRNKQLACLITINHKHDETNSAMSQIEKIQLI